ncbi:Ctr copper transporter [Xylariaceae sp. FL1272]|nr:Ctr copper transporter [Xylariaceae sp. FL1272]
MADDDMMMASEMSMTFFKSFTTPLWSNAWAPTGEGTYVATCIFLILLATTHRFLILLRTIAFDRNINLVSNRHIHDDKESLMSQRTRPPHMGDVRRQLREASLRHPFNFTREAGRSFLEVVISGIGYLLMLAVMTLNVGYFLSVLAGVFLGTFISGRLCT